MGIYGSSGVSIFVFLQRCIKIHRRLPRIFDHECNLVVFFGETILLHLHEP